MFESTRAAKECVSSLHRTTKMGITMSVFLDTLGDQRRKMIEQICGVPQRIQQQTTMNKVNLLTANQTATSSDTQSTKKVR